jgi:hypothetical protein
VTIKKKRVVIRNIDGISTGFIHPVDTETFRMLQYRGHHLSEPTINTNLIAINMYSNRLTLLRRVEMERGTTINDYTYEYKIQDPSAHKRISKTDMLKSPISRTGVAGRNHLQDISYNSKGQVVSGSYIKDGNLIRFQYHYQKSGGSLLRAEFVLPHLSCTVAWCAPPRRKPEKLDSWVSLITCDLRPVVNTSRFHIRKSQKPLLLLVPMYGRASTSMITNSIRPLRLLSTARKSKHRILSCTII